MISLAELGGAPCSSASDGVAYRGASLPDILRRRGCVIPVLGQPAADPLGQLLAGEVEVDHVDHQRAAEALQQPLGFLAPLGVEQRQRLLRAAEAKET